MGYYAKCGCGLCDTEIFLSNRKETAENLLTEANLLKETGLWDNILDTAPGSKETLNFVLVER